MPPVDSSKIFVDPLFAALVGEDDDAAGVLLFMLLAPVGDVEVADVVETEISLAFRLDGGRGLVYAGGDGFVVVRRGD
jgi:hypothetical protein